MCCLFVHYDARMPPADSHGLPLLLLAGYCGTAGGVSMLHCNWTGDAASLYLQRQPAAAASPCSSPSRPAGSPPRWLWRPATAAEGKRVIIHIFKVYFEMYSIKKVEKQERV